MKPNDKGKPTTRPVILTIVVAAGLAGAVTGCSGQEHSSVVLWVTVEPAAPEVNRPILPNCGVETPMGLGTDSKFQGSSEGTQLELKVHDPKKNLIASLAAKMPPPSNGQVEVTVDLVVQQRCQVRVGKGLKRIRVMGDREAAAPEGRSVLLDFEPGKYRFSFTGEAP